MSNVTAATETELCEAVKKSLNDSGSYSQFKAQMRAAVLSVLHKNVPYNPPREIPEETKILNGLIREYLGWNGYIYSEKLFESESGSTCDKIQREHLSSKLGVMDDNKSKNIPLLYYVLSTFRNLEK